MTVQTDFVVRGASLGAMARRGVVGLIACALVAALLYATGRGAFDDRVRVTALVDSVGGALVPGSDVKVDGVIVGQVLGIDSAPGGAQVSLALDPDAAQHIATDSVARVLPATVFGTTFVDLVPAGEGSGSGVRAGQEIPADTSTPSRELQDTLDSAEQVLTAIRPAELNTTLSGLARAIDGRGDELGESLEQLDAYLTRLQPPLDLVADDLRLAARMFGTLSDVAPDLLAAGDASTTTLRTLTEKREELGTLLAKGRVNAETLDTFLTEQRAVIERMLDSWSRAFAALYEYRAGLPAGFLKFVDFAEKGSLAFLDGPFLQTDVYIKTGDDVQYTADDCPRFGTARGANCPEGGTTVGSSSPAASPPAKDDAALQGTIDEISRLLAQMGETP